MCILRGNWELCIFCILRKMGRRGPLYFPCATCSSALGILCNICGLCPCLQFMWETLISVGDCIIYIPCGTSKLNYQKNRCQMVKELIQIFYIKENFFSLRSGPVLWILDILVRIRIQIRRSYHWLTDPVPDPAPNPALFVRDLQDVNKK